MRNESEGIRIGVLRWDPAVAFGCGCTIGRSLACEGFEREQTCADPKDGELCLDRVKSGETLMEARSDTDVQIVRLIWV